ncbi:unnamed protein product [Didymodactylos carnosus]|uniref:GH18 domain-containing protein n=1 Tax=Didymodactylos carnosus TaxID=1234261 RepID=A0A815BJ31_9BILA|nr:unnamed protein product [Didymodactylos carnosus]CAF4063036.1 unnamed protein product [Didymodactylos carnosus]
MSYSSQPKYRRICYFTNWGAHRSMKEARLYPEDIPANLCTHILYAFATLSGQNLQAQIANDLQVYQGEQPLYPRIMKLKEQNPDLKVLISCGGWGKAGEFDSLVGSNEASKNVIKFCRQHGFDGVDLDWEFPGADQKERFGLLAKTMYKIFKKEAKKSNKERLLISIATAAGEFLIKKGYDVPVLCKYLDMINVMTYDLYGSWHNKIGHHSALYHREGETGMERELNTNTSMYNWVTRGCPREKLHIGIPGYGRAFSASGNNPLKAFGQSGGGSGGVSSPYLGESGLLAYFEICRKEAKEGFKRYWHKQHQIPVSFKDGTWIGYDDPDSVRNKCKYVKREQFGGAMIWTLDMDDFHGNFCKKHGTKFPLISAMKEEFELEDDNNVNVILSTTTTNKTRTMKDDEDELASELDQMNEFNTLLDLMLHGAVQSASQIKQIKTIKFYLLLLFVIIIK